MPKSLWVFGFLNYHFYLNYVTGLCLGHLFPLLEHVMVSSLMIEHSVLLILCRLCLLSWYPIHTPGTKSTPSTPRFCVCRGLRQNECQWALSFASLWSLPGPPASSLGVLPTVSQAPPHIHICHQLLWSHNCSVFSQQTCITLWN
jgi:hypothetical protein